MQTVITQELAVIDNRLRATKRHVYLVGENLSFEIEIRKFNSELRILGQCDDCRFAKVTRFSPKNCEDSKNMSSTTLECANGENVWREAFCGRFYPAAKNL